MTLLFTLLAIALIVAKAFNKIDVSWTTAAAVAAALFFIPRFLSGGSNLFSRLFGNGRNTDDPTQIDACGCGPGQSIALSRRNIWGKWKPAGIAPCSVALSRISSKKWRIDGCV